MALKEGDAVCLSRSAGNRSNTMWPARRSTSVSVVQNFSCQTVSVGFAEQTSVFGHSMFKVIQGHQFWYQSTAHTPLSITD